MRKRGHSLKEVAEKLDIAKSTASLWLREIHLDDGARERLQERRLLGYYKQTLRRQERKVAEEQLYKIKARSVLKNVAISSSTAKFLAAVIFWCEGSKNERGSVRLINSDPNVISSFLYLARKGFGVPRNRWKARVHLHEYHSDRKQKQFWANRTGIPIKNFYRSYRKPNTGKRERENYPGCLALTCHNGNFLKELKSIWGVFSETAGRVR